MVVDQNYGVTERLKCFVFDPIDGDGSTRTCTVQSNVGSQEYRAAMFVGASKKGDPISALRGCSDKLKDVRSNEFTKAQNDKFVLIKAPGNLGKNQFNGQDIISLKSAMGRMHKNNPDTVTNETVHYPGLSINIELDGVWGFTPGNAISSTQETENDSLEKIADFLLNKKRENFLREDGYEISMSKLKMGAKAVLDKNKYLNSYSKMLS